MHTPVSSFLRSGRLHSSWLTPLSAVTASFLRLCILSEVDAPLPAALWDVCKRCMQVKSVHNFGGNRVMCGLFEI
jgi:hypothetical protein